MGPRVVVLVASCCALLSLSATAHAAEPALRAGAGSADITAPVGTPMFAYTARSYVFSPDPEALAERAMQLLADPDTGLYAKSFEPSTGIHTRLKARALVLEQDGKKYALVQADLGGVPYALTQEVLKRVAKIGITGERLMLSATHTHSGTGPIWPADNSGYAFVGGDAFDPRAFEITATGIAEAIFAANRQPVPAQLGVGTADLRDASRNREYDVFKRNPEVKDLSPEQQKAGSIDPTVTVVRVDRAGGKGPLAVWSNFAIHPTSFGDGNSLFSGDNAAVAAEIVEKTIERREGKPIVNVWTNSAQGDTSPDGDNRKVADENERWVSSDAAKAHLAGKRTSVGILAAWKDAGKRMSSHPELGAKRTFFTFDGSAFGATPETSEPVGPYPVLGVGIVSEGICAPFDGFAGPGQGEKMPLLGGPGLAPSIMPVSLWRIGDQGIAAYPSEITKQMGARIRDGLVKAAGGQLSRVAIAGTDQRLPLLHGDAGGVRRLHLRGQLYVDGSADGLRLAGRGRPPRAVPRARRCGRARRSRAAVGRLRHDPDLRVAGDGQRRPDRDAAKRGLHPL